VTNEASPPLGGQGKDSCFTGKAAFLALLPPIQQGRFVASRLPPPFGAKAIAGRSSLPESQGFRQVEIKIGH